MWAWMTWKQRPLFKKLLLCRIIVPLGEFVSTASLHTSLYFRLLIYGIVSPTLNSTKLQIIINGLTRYEVMFCYELVNLDEIANMYIQ